MNNFDYVQPKKLKEASRLLEKGWQQAVPYAGGTDVLGLIKDKVMIPEQVVNLKQIPELNKIEYKPGKGLKIGALTTIADIAEHPVISEKYPILTQTAQEIASPQLRNLGTVGGNICQRPRCWYFRGDFHCLRKDGDECYAADGQNKYHCVIGGGPCFIVHPSDMAVCLLALDAGVSIFSGKKNRTMPLRDFFVLPDEDPLRENILKPGEILTEIHIPDLPSDARSGYIKMQERSVWDFAVVSVGAVIRKNGGSIRSGRIVLGGVAPVPWQEETLNRGLSGLAIQTESITELSQKALKDADPLEMNAYKVPLARNLIKRLLIQISSA